MPRKPRYRSRESSRSSGIDGPSAKNRNLERSPKFNYFKSLIVLIGQMPMISPIHSVCPMRRRQWRYCDWFGRAWRPVIWIQEEQLRAVKRAIGQGNHQPLVNL